jgi:hypothetical protein
MSDEAFGRELRLSGRKNIDRVLQKGIRVQHLGMTFFFCPGANGSSPCSPGRKSAAP